MEDKQGRDGEHNQIRETRSVPNKKTTNKTIFNMHLTQWCGYGGVKGHDLPDL